MQSIHVEGKPRKDIYFSLSALIRLVFFPGLEKVSVRRILQDDFLRKVPWFQRFDLLKELRIARGLITLYQMYGYGLRISVPTTKTVGRRQKITTRVSRRLVHPWSTATWSHADRSDAKNTTTKSRENWTKEMKPDHRPTRILKNARRSFSQTLPRSSGTRSKQKAKRTSLPKTKRERGFMPPVGWEDIVICSDAFDVLVLGDRAEIIEKFLPLGDEMEQDGKDGQRWCFFPFWVFLVGFFAFCLFFPNSERRAWGLPNKASGWKPGTSFPKVPHKGSHKGFR